jgi:hypothetical protein
MRYNINAYKGSVRKREGTAPLGKPRSRWEKMLRLTLKWAGSGLKSSGS